MIGFLAPVERSGLWSGVVPTILAELPLNSNFKSQIIEIDSDLAVRIDSKTCITRRGAVPEMQIGGIDILKVVIENEIQLNTLQKLVARLNKEVPQALYDQLYKEAAADAAQKYPGIVQLKP